MAGAMSRTLRETDQIRNGNGPELLHGPAAMDFNRLFRRLQLGCDLFVEQTGNDEAENLKLTRCQFINALARLASFRPLTQVILAPTQSPLHRAKQFFVVERFDEKIHRTFPHGLLAGRHVTMAGEENNLLTGSARLECFLQSEAVQPRHPDIENEAARAVEDFSREIIFGGGKDFRAVSRRLEEALHRPPH